MASGTSFTADASSVEEAVIRIPGAEPADGILAQLINVDAQNGLVASIIRFQPGATIPAHRHETFAEAHYVLEGDLINEGVTHGPGAYITHAPGVVHGPHSSLGGCRVLTLQTGHTGSEEADFHIEG